MFDFIKKLFRHKAGSVEDFVETVKRGSCSAVVAELYSVVVTKRSSENAFQEIVYADFRHISRLRRYMLKLTATMPRGCKVIYRECLFEISWDEPESKSARDKCNSIRSFLLGEKKVEELRAILPGVSVDLLVGVNRRPMNDEMHAKLLRAAATHGVEV